MSKRAATTAPPLTPEERARKDAHTNALRRHGSHEASIEQLLTRREQLIDQIDKVTASVNEHYLACLADERVLGRVGVIPPGRRRDVTHAPRVTLLENPPIDFAALSAKVQAAALARQTPEDRAKLARAAEKERENAEHFARVTPRMAGGAAFPSGNV